MHLHCIAYTVIMHTQVQQTMQSDVAHHAVSAVTAHGQLAGNKFIFCKQRSDSCTAKDPNKPEFR